MKKSIVTFVLLPFHNHFKLLIAILSIHSSMSIYGQNILVNGDFEDGLTGWNPILSNEGDATLFNDNSTFVNGSSCGAITILASNGLGGFAQNITLEPGTSYEVKCWCKTQDLDGLALPYLNLNDQSLMLEFGILPEYGTNDWVEGTARFICPEQVSNATLFLFVPGNSGTAYFDHVQFNALPMEAQASFTVDIAQETGTIRPFMQTNAGPLYPGFENQNLSPQFEALQIDFVRTHDFYGPCDIHTIFPNPNANENDPASYNFEDTDEVISSIIATGAQVLFRLGESYSMESLYNNPPSDNAKFATICKNIVRHYNEGWNNGFNYGIMHWEIWNEPDLNHFWNGTPEQFVSMYGAVANELEAYDPSLIIIGPAVSSMVSEWFVDAFLEGVTEQNLPIDAFSYHMYYMANPYGFKLMDDIVDEKLAEFGLQNLPHYLTEWNNYTYSANGSTEVWRNDPFIGASTSASLIYLQESQLVQAYRYRSNEYIFGLFDENVNPTYSGLSYQQFSNYNNYPTKHHTSGADSLGTAILAGANTSDHSFLVTIAVNSEPIQSYTLHLNNFIADSIAHLVIHRIDSTHQNAFFQDFILTEQNPFITIDCSPPFVDQVLIDFQQPSGIESLSLRQIEELRVFPNPTSDFVQILLDSKSANTCMVYLFDNSGKCVYQETNRKILPGSQFIDISMNDMPFGAYTVLVQTGNEAATARVVLSE